MIKVLEKYNKGEIENANNNIFDFNNYKLVQFKKAIESDELIIFWGAGLSRLCGCQSWEGLTINVINKLTPSIFDYSESNLLKEICETDLRKVLSICRNRSIIFKVEDKFFEAIRESVEPEDGKVEIFKEIHELLLNLDAYAYITTNIDMGMERVSDKFKNSQTTYDLTNKNQDLKNISKEVKNGNIFYLHGTKKNIGDSIFNNENYFKFYNDDNIRSFLQEIFLGRKTVLFIGYGLGDYELLTNIFLASHSEKMDSNLKHYALIPIYSNELNKISIEKEYLKIYSIFPLFYFIDYDNYGILKDILINLREIVNKAKSPKISKLDLVDSIK